MRLASCALRETNATLQPARCSNSEQSSSGPLGDIRSAERWVASLPANDPLVAQRSIVAELHKLAARTARRTPAVLEAVFVVDTHVERARAQPDDAIRRAREPLAQDRGPALACAVRARARIRSSATRRSPARSPIPCPATNGRRCCRSLIARQIVHLGRDAKLRLYRASAGPTAKWTEFFTPFTRACALRIEREPLRLDAMGGPTTIERQFLMIAGAEARRSRQPRAKADRMDRRAARGMVPAAAAHAEARRRPRRSTSTSPAARACSAARWRRSKAACCSSTCSPCTR